MVTAVMPIVQSVSAWRSVHDLIKWGFPEHYIQIRYAAKPG